MNFIELIRRQADLVFGNKAKADHWLNQPMVGVITCSRLQAAHSEAGYELVKAELEKLSHGFAS
ncbi:MbcA/ParS/Xre antitoxin family protein [Pseudomonas sp. NPDC089530]|uniref:MbcA/ParS/Xre antitoxin family protein n=1 Tax=Pseudomonas sp. NPDC089530 TaxID=3390651 RepID=UPI003D085697